MWAKKLKYSVLGFVTIISKPTLCLILCGNTFLWSVYAWQAVLAKSHAHINVSSVIWLNLKLAIRCHLQKTNVTCFHYMLLLYISEKITTRPERTCIFHQSDYRRFWIVIILGVSWQKKIDYWIYDIVENLYYTLIINLWIYEGLNVYARHLFVQS